MTPIWKEMIQKAEDCNYVELKNLLSGLFPMIKWQSPHIETTEEKDDDEVEED